MSGVWRVASKWAREFDCCSLASERVGVGGRQLVLHAVSADGEVEELGMVAGHTCLTDEEIMDWLRWYVEHSPAYSILHNNCQHFVLSFCEHAIGCEFNAPIRDDYGGIVQTILTTSTTCKSTNGSL